VAGGNKQQDYISKEDASSPTVTKEAVLLSCIINAKRGRDVAVVDIPNAFIQTQVEDERDMAIIKICGVLVDILVQIAPEVYKSYVTTDKKGTKQLLVQCQNALYGTMVASLLYYRKFTKSLTSVGFKINPYDPCMANDKICMMMTRLACNEAIESSYWRMDNDSDVGLLMGYVLYRLPVELEFMDLDTFPH
jgi:hypothetical protein